MVEPVDPEAPRKTGQPPRSLRLLPAQAGDSLLEQLLPPRPVYRNLHGLGFELHVVCGLVDPDGVVENEDCVAGWACLQREKLNACCMEWVSHRQDKKAKKLINRA